jgi:hypothetical protein
LSYRKAWPKGSNLRPIKTGEAQDTTGFSRVEIQLLHYNGRYRGVSVFG